MRELCPSCNTPYVGHLGLVGTCLRLQEAVRVAGSLEEERDRYLSALKKILGPIGHDYELVQHIAREALSEARDE